MKELGEVIEADCITERAGEGAPAAPQAPVEDGVREIWDRLDRETYAKQLAAWLLVVSGMKVAMVALMLVLAASIYEYSSLLLSPLESDPTAKLVVVMIVTPCVMNGVQFWLQDNIF